MPSRYTLRFDRQIQRSPPASSDIESVSDLEGKRALRDAPDPYVCVDVGHSFGRSGQVVELS